jgi:hypothetical protein
MYSCLVAIFAFWIYFRMFKRPHFLFCRASWFILKKHLHFFGRVDIEITDSPHLIGTSVFLVPVLQVIMLHWILFVCLRFLCVGYRIPHVLLLLNQLIRCLELYGVTSSHACNLVRHYPGVRFLVGMSIRGCRLRRTIRSYLCSECVKT